jgi:catechol 2,3-dioxygenase-like lactoylglutathione lyase family enzyme
MNLVLSGGIGRGPAGFSAARAHSRKVKAPDEAIGPLTRGFIEDPWGVKVEIVQDADLLGFHHVHLSVADPQASLAWYQKMFGGELARLKGQTDGVRYGQTWLLAANSGQHAAAPSADRAIQCLAWSIDNRDRAVETLTSRSVKIINSGVSKVEGEAVLWAYVEDPNGVRIELLQRPR